MDYGKDIKLAKEKGVIAEGEIFDFRDTPYESLCNDFYAFCRVHLNNSMENYSINPTVFVYTSVFEPNAMAQLKNDTFSIHINIGLIKNCKESFLNNKSLDEYLIKHYSNTIKYFDNPITGLAFQVATQFTYYHEFAHLVQFSKKRENCSLQERFIETSTYDGTKHCLETNADTLASIAVVSHIQQYIQESFGEDITQEHIEVTIAIICSCLLSHIASFCDNLPDIYFKDHSHPHPFLRLFLVNLNIVNYLNQSQIFKSKGVEIETNKIFKKVLDLNQEFEKNMIFKSSIYETMDNAAKQQSDIVEYMGDLIQFNLEEYHDAIEQWNKNVK